MPKKNGDLKKAVRERKARTGESYSIARMRTLGSARTSALFDPTWPAKVGQFIAMPHRQDAAEWTNAVLDGLNKGAEDFGPLVRDGAPARHLPRPTELPPEDDEQHLLQRELERTRVDSVESAWAFLRPKRSDDVVLARAKAGWRSRGVVEVHQLLGVPSDLNLVMFDGRTGAVDPRWRVVRCSRCAKDLGDVNVTVVIKGAEEFVAVASAWQARHRQVSHTCRTAFAVVGREPGTRASNGSTRSKKLPIDQVEILKRATGAVVYADEARLIGNILKVTARDLVMDVFVEGDFVEQTISLAKITRVSAWRE